MKAIVINKQGKTWEFKSVKEAKPFLKKDAFYREERVDGKIVRIYDDREL